MGASTNDISLFQQCYDAVLKMGFIFQLDAAICDRVFAHAIPPASRTLKIFYGHREQPNIPLQPWQKRENVICSNQRGKILIFRLK